MNYDLYTNEFDSILNDPYFAGFLLIFIIIVLFFSIIAYLVTALIYFQTSKTNGFRDVAYIAWIPFVNVYSLFLLIANYEDDTTNRSIAKRNTLIYYGLFIVSFIPFIGYIASIGMIGFMLYAMYQLFYRWSGETGKAILYIILTFFTAGLFFAVYGLTRMNRPFRA